MQVRVSNDLIHWVCFFLNGVAQTAIKGRDVFHQILALRTEAEQMVLGLGKRARSARLALSLFYRKPIINAEDIERELNITTPTANALIKALIKLGILVEITGQQRWRSYAFERYLKLFLS